MARKKSKHPTALELEILKILWVKAPRTVREVRETMLASGRELAHTSLITTLNVMFDKGFVKRTTAKESRGYAFSPKVSRADVSQGMVGDLVERVFEGSASALLLSLLENEQLDDADHAELRRAINRYRRGEQT
ncbi:Transcriptional regulator BlaI [Novipirellula aureliae]|uniref:Transcriptional regulator BlaI n=1 Tax=Novipirellula aureliae TaxID=2527966 RepID=A0A5C6DS34_9BACT|nr:BlaI/MecI/CopY family transcriptional regulator [Novipirellula aureliae]TWU37856.1 Transcriptional regulator BlaI [Novipirellula aureliae]